MKKLIVLCLLILLFPFLNALLFVPPIKADLELEYPYRKLSFSADSMWYHEYQLFDNGVIRTDKGIYGYLFGTMYVVFYEKTYSYVPEGVVMADQYRSDFKNKGRTFVTVTMKRVPSSKNKAIMRIRYPGEGGGYQYARATVDSESKLKPLF